MNLSFVITNILECACDMCRSFTKQPFLEKMSSLLIPSLELSLLREKYGEN